MSVNVDLRIVQLMCSRLCHDFAGLVGAVNNGIELIAELGGPADPEALALVADSAGQMSRKLQFLRVAFGFSPGAVRTAPESHDLASAFFGSGKVALDWTLSDLDARVALSEDEIKLLLNMMLLAEAALPRGGVISVRLDPASAGIAAAVTARGEGARVNEEIRIAAEPVVALDDVTARTVQGYYCARLAESIGGHLEVDDSRSDAVSIRAALSATE